MGTPDSKGINVTSKRPTIFLQTFGCQMNKLDSSLVETALRQAGFDFIDNVTDADVVLLNTCSVRDHAEHRVLSHLGHLKHIKESKPDLVVGVIGCMAQRLGDELFKQSAVDIVCGPARIAEIPRLIAEALQGKHKVIAVEVDIRKSSENPSLERFEIEYGVEDTDIPGQAYVRAMHGCDKFCSYCVVPYVRGPETSRPPEAIIEQVKRLAQHGIKQVTLLGQRINAYEYKAGPPVGETPRLEGREACGSLKAGDSPGAPGYCLADLLEMVSGVDGIEWIRFITSYPSKKYFKEIMEAVAALPKVCRYLHLPAQSGSDKILKAMNRGYTSAEYLELIEIARQIVPDMAIAGDFIVGFPGETEDDFAQSVDLLKKAQYKNAFVFKYSPRPGTIADKRLEDNIPEEIKNQRNNELLKAQGQIGAKLAEDFSGKTVKVLVEGPSKKSHKRQVMALPQLIGRTAGDWIVVFNGPESLAGQFATVKINRTSPLTLFGEIP